MSATGKARKVQKVETPKRPSVVPLAAAKRPTREELLASVEPPLLTLDEILIVGKAENPERLVLTGADLARVLSVVDKTPGQAYGLADGGDVNLMLRGLSELIQGHENDNHIGGDGAYFLARTLDGLAARLEAHAGVEQFSVFLRKKGADRKAGAA